MNGYVSRAACRGRRPAQFGDFLYRERSAPLSLLLKDRRVARFIVAPDGYGKTSLALEYAETIFAWSHTLWFNAQSPCFIRDIDQVKLSGDCLSFDEDLALVVFDDVPPLDSDRAEGFSREIDELLASGCEVIVTCTPLCDMAGAYQPDRIRVGAHDLLLNDEELDSGRTPDQRRREPAESFEAPQRIVSLAWGKEGESHAAFAKAALNEEMPADLLLVMASVLVLGRGSVDGLLSIARSFDRGQLGEVLVEYPHVGFDADRERFVAAELNVEEIAVPLKKRLGAMVERSSFESTSQLVKAWADVLIEEKQPERACDLMFWACSRSARAAWLINHARTIMRHACILPMLRLAVYRKECKMEAKMRLAAIEALCRSLLGDEVGALKCASKHAFAQGMPEDARMCCLLIVSRKGAGSLAEKAYAMLVEKLQCSHEALWESDWLLLAKAWETALRGPRELGLLWEEYWQYDVAPDVLNVCASWYFGLLEKDYDADDDALRMQGLCEGFVLNRLPEGQEDEVDFFAVSAGLSLEEARMRGARLVEGPPGTQTLMALRRVETNMLYQRQAFEVEQRAAARRRDDWATTHPDTVYERGADTFVVSRAESIPPLQLRLFGGFDVAIGGVPIDKRKMSRKNTRSLLVMLAASRGKELSREAAAEALWPQSTKEHARRNYYTVWSNLRRALTLPDGTCPYLVRRQFGCCLESRYLESDIDRLNEICRELQFGVPNMEQWTLLYAELDKDFAGDLMPFEHRNAMVVKMRNDYRNRLVDALVSATNSIVEAGSPQWAVWFARAALDHDETREDAYLSMMRAQVESDQRTAAMSTFLTCRKVLSDRLGIDPSPEIIALYESLLDMD